MAKDSVKEELPQAVPFEASDITNQKQTFGWLLSIILVD